MKKTILVISVLSLLVFVLVSFSEGNKNYSIMKFDGGPPSNTNAPGEKTCSGPEGTNNCHSGGGVDNSGPGTPSIVFGGGITNYTPGQTYSVKPSITRTSRNRFGFQIVSLRNSDNANMGTITIATTDTGKMRTQQPTWAPFQNRNYTMHKINGTFFPGTTYKGEWTYSWQAPATNQGAITFYACFVAANNDGKNDPGDEVYYTTLTITPAVNVIQLPSDESNSFSIYPNPVKDVFYIGYNLDAPCSFKVELFNLEGKIIQAVSKEDISPGLKKEEVKLDESVSAGVYIVRIKTGDREHNQKIVVK